MSNSGVNTGFAKCFIFFMAVVILLQGAVYLGLSIWGITLRQCSKEATDISKKPFQFAMDLIYFMNENCGAPSVTVPGNTESVSLNVNFNQAEQIENRTFILLITYAVISALWIVTSLAVISTLCGRLTKTVNGLCFWPWFLVIMAGCILDVVATGYNIHDILNTTTVEKTFNYLGITTDENVLKVLSDFDAYFITPAVVMTCISSRVILIWLLNIFGSSFCLSLSNTLSKRSSSKQSSVNSLATTVTAPVTSPQQPQQQQQPPANVVEQSKPSLQPLQIQVLQRQASAQQQQSNQNNRSNIQSPTTVPVMNPYPTAPSPNVSQANSEVTVTYRNTETHPDRLNYPLQRNTSQYQQELSPISPLNNRYSTTNESFQFPMQNQRVSEELRGQLPWSYTSMPPPVPKKPQMQVYPEIPTPDYGH